MPPLAGRHLPLHLHGAPEHDRHPHGPVGAPGWRPRPCNPAAPAVRGGLYAWLTTTDHKKIGILYLINSLIFFVAGGVLALVVRLELAIPGLQLDPDEPFYNQAFTMHASFMLFLFIIPILAGFGNYAVPLQIGAPDMAFPRINAL